MSNMSYCRFANTLRDLLDCEENMGTDSSGELGISERKARIELILTCCRIAEDYGEEA